MISCGELPPMRILSVLAGTLTNRKYTEFVEVFRSWEAEIIVAPDGLERLTSVAV
jgi:hypothetical protein